MVTGVVCPEVNVELAKLSLDCQGDKGPVITVTCDSVVIKTPPKIRFQVIGVPGVEPMKVEV
jgi:hypothetical protein